MQSRPINQQTLQNLFRRADTNNNGQIDARELQGALSNGLNIPFNINVVTLMIKMFDRDYSGHIEFNEFANLFTYVDQWKTCFQRFDTDNSGFIDAQELHRALCTFRYNLSIDFIHLLMRRFDRTRRGQMAFDDFIHACVCLQLLTNAFRPLDTGNRGWAQMSFEQFLNAAMSIV
ncbi:Programmed cell death protein 6 [Paragonimus heterotremus]|uniref:Programmed cell death protein 6 n=1 Tax=Paragonimus heterotremus TaxID=100268 RepID=A0A8J4T4C2_9TREM|nr:Programmed cell death protein 6 [Paragonimus heterotremus]